MRATSLQAELVDLLGRHRGRGVLGDEEPVPGLAVRQRRPGDARARARQVLVVHEGAQPTVRGHQLVADRGCVCGGQPLTIGGAEARRKIADRSVVVALRRIIDDHRVELRQHLLHDRPRLHDALRHAFAHVDDRLVDPDDEAVETHEPLVVVLDGRERLRIGARAERRHRRLEPAGLVDRDAGNPGNARTRARAHVPAGRSRARCGPVRRARWRRSAWRRPGSARSARAAWRAARVRCRSAADRCSGYRR